MKNRTVVLSIALACWLLSPFGGVGGGLFAQGVGINANGAAPAASTMLDISSNNKGLLIPRLPLTSITDIVTITAPATSLLIYNTATAGTVPNDVTPGFYYWDGSQWVRIVSGNIVGTDNQNLTGASLTGNTLQIDIENGTSTTVDLTSVLATAGTDNQNLTAATLVGTILTITIENGNPVNIDLASLVNDLDSDPTNEYNTGANLTGTDLNIIDGGSTLTVDMVPLLDSAKVKEEWADGSIIGTPGMIYAKQAKSFGKNVIVSDSGQVGIATLQPKYLLDIQNRIYAEPNNSVTIGLSIREYLNSGWRRGYHFMSEDETTNLGGFYANGSGANITPGLNYLAMGQFNGFNAALDMTNGYFGIGTITPLGRLHVKNDLDAIEDSVFIVTPGGKVGIGTTAPNRTLVVGNNAIQLSGINAAGTTSDIYFKNQGMISSESNTFFAIDSDNNSPTGEYFGFIKDAEGFSAGTAVELMRIQEDGNVGVGTQSPTAKLSVNGTANKPGGGAWAVFSDRKLKKNISNYTEGLSLITKVNTINFQYNSKLEEIWGGSNDIKDKTFQGVIAQELQKIAPDMVRAVAVDLKDKEGNSTGTETVLEVDPNKFTYALINAVKDLSAISEEQQQLIEQLQKEMQEMKTLLKQK